MATLIKRFLDDVIGPPDPVNLELPLVSGGPMAMIGTVVVFLMTIKVWAPKYMSTRKAYNLKNTIQCINLLQIAVNVWIFKEILFNVEIVPNSWCIRKHDTSYGPGYRIARAMYVYYLMKVFDMVDSVVFILRKKLDQLSFLHVFHHVCTFWLAFLAATYHPGGPSSLIQLMNSAVHITMYFYYFLASFGSRFQKYLWWKKYLTSMQILQFLMMIFYMVPQLLMGCDDRTKFIVYTGFPILIIYIILFNAFYNKKYSKKITKEKHK